MADLLRRILYPAFVATIIATVWAVGHAQAMAEQAYNRRYWPVDALQGVPFEPEGPAVDDNAVAAVLIDEM
jgi:hypothetical protein